MKKLIAILVLSLFAAPMVLACGDDGCPVPPPPPDAQDGCGDCGCPIPPPPPDGPGLLGHDDCGDDGCPIPPFPPDQPDARS